MATLSSLEKEVESLKRENRHIIRRLNALEGHKPSVKASETVSQNKSPVGGILLIIFGALICFIGIGILIGIPLLVWGIIIVNKSSSKSAETMHIKAHTAKHEEPVKHIKAARKTSVESDIGIKWFSWIGILALVLGVGFFVKYAIDNGWISHLTRLVLGGVVGVGIFILGELMMKKYSRLGKVLAGGGIAILYFIIYAAYHFYDYRMATGIPLWLDITLLSIVVLIAVLFSVAKDSQAIIIEAFFLGYATSLLSNSFGVLSLVYTAMLTISLAFVVWYKKWPYIGVGGLFATYLVYRFSTAGYEFVTGFSFLTIYFVTFVILSLAMKKEGSAIPMIIGNSILYYIFSELLIDKYYPDYLGLFTLVLSILYMVIYFLHKDKKIGMVNLIVSLFFLTITVPIQLSSDLVTIVWALETLVLTGVFVKTGKLRVVSLIMGGVTVVKTIFFDSWYLKDIVLGNAEISVRLISYLFTIAAFYTCFALLMKKEKQFSVLYSWFATGLLALIVALELSDHHYWISIIYSAIVLALVLLSRKYDFDYQAVSLSVILLLKVLLYDSYRLTAFDINNILGSTRFFAFICAATVFYLTALLLDKKNPFRDYFSWSGTLLLFVLFMLEFKEYWISVGWSILALTVLALGFGLKRKTLRMQGIIIFGITILKVFLYDTRNLATLYRTVSFIVLGCILLFVSFIYAKYKDRLKEII